MLKKNKPIPSIDTLGNRERQILLLLVKGQRTCEIAMQLNIKANTVSTMKKIILKKLNINNSLELFQYATEQKIITQ